VDNLLRTAMQLKVAISAIPPSVVRRQGRAGLLGVMRTYCAKYPLERLSHTREATYRKELRRATLRLQKAARVHGCGWGAVRKALNLFFRDATYNHYLRDEFSLSAVERFLELPLDGEVAHRLLAEPGAEELTQWPNLNGLTEEVSESYQAFATLVARRKKIKRVHLDLFYWPAISRR
jgi:hypothetical protein